MSCANTGEPIEMPSGLLSRVDPMNDTLDGKADVPSERGTFIVVSGPLQSISGPGVA